MTPYRYAYAILILPILIVIIFAAYRYMNPPGHEPASVEPGVTCFETDEFLVAARERGDMVGTDILIKRKAAASDTMPCLYRVADGDIELEDQGAAYVLEVIGQYLLLDIGTAPPPRGLAVIDMNTGNKVYTGMYNRPLDIGGRTVEFWQPIDTAPTAENCPDLAQLQSNGLGAGLERHVSLSLDTLKIADLGEVRCSARQ